MTAASSPKTRAASAVEPPRTGALALPEPLVGLCRADQYERQKKFWQELTQQWRAEVAASLEQVRAKIEKQNAANRELRDNILSVMQAAPDPREPSVADVMVLKNQWADTVDAARVGVRDANRQKMALHCEPGTRLVDGSAEGPQPHRPAQHVPEVFRRGAAARRATCPRAVRGGHFRAGR
ncbi:hypothetical protein [Streptomyces sp. NTK 937]|uniref:hypothetical protein n=1 Tax=Streptomyces sp. NTK 937 TaxID=1487711 RepID=UPI0012FEEAA8|nr:hypothetical protein [Streptomyces sp. NTK 937]